jgi:hypothetical protein
LRSGHNLSHGEVTRDLLCAGSCLAPVIQVRNSSAYQNSTLTCRLAHFRDLHNRFHSQNLCHFPQVHHEKREVIASVYIPLQTHTIVKKRGRPK